MIDVSAQLEDTVWGSSSLGRPFSQRWAKQWAYMTSIGSWECSASADHKANAPAVLHMLLNCAAAAHVSAEAPKRTVAVHCTQQLVGTPPGHEVWVAAQQNVCPSASHVGSNRYLASPAALCHNLRLPLHILWLGIQQLQGSKDTKDESTLAAVAATLLWGRRPAEDLYCNNCSRTAPSAGRLRNIAFHAGLVASPFQQFTNAICKQKVAICSAHS